MRPVRPAFAVRRKDRRKDNMLAGIAYVCRLVSYLVIGLPGMTWRTVKEALEKWWYSHY